jgi:hypothetical protein
MEGENKKTWLVVKNNYIKRWEANLEERRLNDWQ